MFFPKTGRIITLCLSVSGSLLFGLIFDNWTVVQKLELYLQDRLMQLRSSQTVPEDILLIKLEEKDFRERELFVDPSFYTALVSRLLEDGAAVIILNLRQNWIQEGREVNEGSIALKTLIEQQKDKLVLVTSTPRLKGQVPEFPVYNRFLPFSDDELSYAVSPEEIQGFFEYEGEAENPINLTSSARQAHLFGQFIPRDNPEQIKVFKSVAVLALEKLNKNQLKNSINPIQIDFIHPQKEFNSLTLQDFCDFSEEQNCQSIENKKYQQEVKNKIVIIGFVTEKDNQNVLPITSPFGRKIPGMEVQANLLVSLKEQTYYKLYDYWLQAVIVVIGGILVGISIENFHGHIPEVLNNSTLNNKKQKKRIKQFLGVVLFYLIFTSMSWYFRIITPIFLPCLTWLGTGIIIAIWSKFEIQEALIIQQKNEINQLKSIEQDAIIAQTRKLLYRTASDIHDGPLQELKLIMDEIELNSIQKIDFILDKLEAIGHDIRKYLNNIRGSADKLEVTPELREGLEPGIRFKLEQMLREGDLKLEVIFDLHPLQEPIFNSAWIDAREDIYRFFREAIANVIRHAQPPHGTATQLTVSLFQQDEKCTLIIHNNALTSQISQNQASRTGGYGTKIMTTIASELPDGYWERITLEDGGVQVKLGWRLNFNGILIANL